MPDDVERHGESEAFAAAGLRQDHGVNAQQLALEIHQRASRVAGVHGCVGLDVGAGIVGIELAVNRADQSQRGGLRQSHGASVGQYQLALTRVCVAGQVKEGDPIHFDLEEREIVVDVDSGHGGNIFAGGFAGSGAARRLHQNPDAGGVGHDMGVGDKIAIGSDKKARPAAALGHQNPGGLLVAGSGHLEGLGHDLRHLGSDHGGDALRLAADAVKFPNGGGARSRSQNRRGQHQQTQACRQP